MKRTPLQRKTRLTAKHSNGKPRTPLKKVNVERQAKRRKSYAQKLASYRRSETYKIVKARAGGRCEQTVDLFLFAEPGGSVETQRCDLPVKHHHHKTYARFGGKELPEDMIAVCEGCHRVLEILHPTRRHGR